MGFFKTVSRYFKKIGLVSTHTQTKHLLLPDKTIPDIGGALNRIINDQFPKGTVGTQANDYAEALYPKVAQHEKDMWQFCTVLAAGLRELLDNTDPLPVRFRGAEDAGKKLIDYFETMAQMQHPLPMSKDEFGQMLHCVMYFMVNGCIAQEYSELVNGLQIDREEFMKNVVTKFGCSGKPGVYAIYNLADRDNPNSIALYEAGELEYYGKGFSQGVPDYAAAYKYYKKAVEGKVYNPLAGWSLGYVLYHYRDRNKRDNELRDAYIPDIDYLKPEDRKQMAIPHLLTSFHRGCPAAANVLAVIAEDTSIPAIYKDQIKSAEEYLIVASNAGYVYAKNKLAARCFSRANTLSGKEKDELMQKGYDYLQESANLGEPWAMNKYALMLHDNNQLREAYGYFKRAARARFEFAGLNLLEKYYLPTLAQGKSEVYGDEIPIKLINQLWALCKTSTDEKLLQTLAELEEAYANIFAQLR